MEAIYGLTLGVGCVFFFFLPAKGGEFFGADVVWGVGWGGGGGGVLGTWQQWRGTAHAQWALSLLL